MFLFRMISFVLQIFSTICIVLFLQISFGEKSLEDRLNSFLKFSKTTEPLRETVQSGVQLVYPEAYYEKGPLEQDNNSSLRNAASILQSPDNIQGRFLSTVFNWIYPAVAGEVKNFEEIQENLGEKLQKNSKTLKNALEDAETTSKNKLEKTQKDLQKNSKALKKKVKDFGPGKNS